MDNLVKSKNLSKQEQKNVYLAVACGCLNSIYNNIPGPRHQKRKRSCQQAHDMVLHTIAPVLPPVLPHNMELFKDTIHASSIILDDLGEEYIQRIHIMLNLASFCLNELPANDKVWRKFNPLFDLWPGVWNNKDDIKAGERIFIRIDAEVQIQVAQRGGVIL